MGKLFSSCIYDKNLKVSLSLIILRYNLEVWVYLQNKCMNKYLYRKIIDNDTKKWDNIYAYLIII